MTKTEIRAAYQDGLKKLPHHMHDGVTSYIEHGREMGGFLTALFEGDNERAECVADMANRACWTDWQLFLPGYVPAKAHGSPGKVAAWRKMGGLDGYPDGA